jgi:regulator of sigma E protease
MSVIIFVVILLVLVLVHEWGHFFSAKKFGIRVDEFGFGFPPKLFGIKKGETEYTFNALPFGGFVKIFGENPDEASISGPDSSRSLVSKPRWQQAIVMFAGIFMNLVLAWVLFSVGFLSGMPASVGSARPGVTIENANLMVISTVKDSPAMTAGIKPKDKIVLVESNGESIGAPTITPEIFQAFIANSKGEDIRISVLRGEDDRFESVTITPVIQDGKPFIGVAMDTIGVLRMPFFKAIGEGMRLTVQVTKGTAVGLYKLVSEGIKGKGSFDSVTGPVGIVGIVGDAYAFGFVYLLSFAALISINLAIINLVPFPALDGGRLLFLLIEKIKGSRISPKIANYANMFGFIILILLMLVVTYHDILKLL